MNTPSLFDLAPTELDGFSFEEVQTVWIACNVCGEAELLNEDTPALRRMWVQNHLLECDLEIDE